MPIFDYVCGKCLLAKEALVGNSDDDVFCSVCEEKMQKLIPAPGLLRTNFHDKPSVRKR